MRVLDHHAVKSGGRIDARLGDRGRHDVIDALIPGRRARKPTRMDDSDKRTRDAEESLDDALIVHRAQCKAVPCLLLPPVS